MSALRCRTFQVLQLLASDASQPPVCPAARLIARRLASPVEPDGDPLDDPLAIETARELPLFQAIGDWLCAHIARWQTTIELNPTSNLLIGALDHPLSQPGFRIRPMTDGEPRALLATVSADEPITFATCAADEYAYAWAGMVCEGGVSPGAARGWVEEAAASAWRARFTLPRSVRVAG